MRLLSANYVVPVSSAPVKEGGIVVDQGKIVAVGPSRELRKKYPQATLEEFNQAVLMPGLVNCHTQLEFSSFDGTGREPHFIDWILAQLEFRQQITPEQRRANLGEGILQSIRSGTTCVGDVGDYAGSLPVLLESPLRMTLYSEIITSAAADVQDRYQASLAFVEGIMGQRRDRLRAGIAPYAAYTLSKNLLKVIAKQAGQAGIPLKTHAAESFAEMQFFYDSKGEIADRLFPKFGWGQAVPPAHRKTPIQFLDSIGFLDHGAALIGCLQLADADIGILSRKKCAVIWTPRIQKHLKLGMTPVEKLQKAGVPFGLGTDSAGLQQSHSLWDEMRSSADVPAKELIEGATLGGARVLGLEKEIGSLETGKRADLIAVKIPASIKERDLYPDLVQNTTEREIHSVFIDGEKITT